MLERYSNAYWILGSDEIKYISGYLFTLDGGANYWKSSKQKCCSFYLGVQSNCLKKACIEVKWLKNLLAGLSISVDTSNSYQYTMIVRPLMLR